MAGDLWADMLPDDADFSVIARDGYRTDSRPVTCTRGAALICNSCEREILWTTCLHLERWIMAAQQHHEKDHA